MKLNLKASKHSVGQNVYHLVFKPKYARHLFKNKHFHKVCEGSLRMIAMRYGFLIHVLKVMEDHVHMFVELKPYVPVSKAFQLFKGISSRILRRTFSYLREDGDHLWSPGKFYRSVGNVSADVIDNYIKYSQGSWSLPDSKLPSYYHQKHLAAFA